MARDNAAILRRLAGQVSAVRGLSRHHVDQVSQALAADDPAVLLPPPLADPHPQLAHLHPGLAAQVRSCTEQATQIRRTSHATRSGTTAATKQ
ncbi:hypothetical protein F9C11_26625 [Amycolatopsis sp. VS8301801F10]|uniref:hypothetical protein n=1 Tax=Amycolatopsis sp. VS8301801F10 TaxID=2652442 RepID=UPI0038FC92E4